MADENKDIQNDAAEKVTKKGAKIDKEKAESEQPKDDVQASPKLPKPEPSSKSKKGDADEIVSVCFPKFANTFQVFEGVGVHFDSQGKARTFRRLVPLLKDLGKLK